MPDDETFQQTIERLAGEELDKVKGAPLVHHEIECAGREWEGLWRAACDTTSPYASVSMPYAWSQIEPGRRCPACVKARASRAGRAERTG